MVSMIWKKYLLNLREKLKVNSEKLKVKREGCRQLTDEKLYVLIALRLCVRMKNIKCIT
jgi:hypothetical protein